MRSPAVILALIALLPVASGCASASAKSKPADMPALNVPPPPERIIEAAPEPLPEPVNDLPANPPAPNTSRTARPPAKPPAETKPPADPKPAETTPPPVDPPPVTLPATPSAQLRTPQTADTSNAEKGVRATIDRARGLLSNVDYRALNHERKKAYDDAMRFMKQSEEALGKSNFVFAQAVATKAETLARELAGK